MDKEAQKKLADDFVELLRTTNRDGIEELIRYLQEETDFFTAPASTKYHGAFESGRTEAFGRGSRSYPLAHGSIR